MTTQTALELSAAMAFTGIKAVSILTNVKMKKSARKKKITSVRTSMEVTLAHAKKDTTVK